jgi:hypothetical protein
LFEPRSVQREPMATGPMEEILSGLGGIGPLAEGPANAPAVPAGGGTPSGEGIGSIIGDTFAGLGGMLPAADAGPADAGGIGSAVSGALAGFGGNPLPGLGAGLLDVGSQALHGVESFAREIPGLGGLIPGADGAGPQHAKQAKHPAHGASHGAAQHATAHPQSGAGSHAGAGHQPAKHGSGHPSASHRAARAANPGGPGMLESMHQKARLMQFEAGALDTAATVGTGISNFAHEIPFVNELL